MKKSITNIVFSMNRAKHKTVKTTVLEIARTETESQSIMVADKFIFPREDKSLSVGIVGEFVYDVRVYNYATKITTSTDVQGSKLAEVLLSNGFEKSLPKNDATLIDLF